MLALKKYIPAMKICVELILARQGLSIPVFLKSDGIAFAFRHLPDLKRKIVKLN